MSVAESLQELGAIVDDVREEVFALRLDMEEGPFAEQLAALRNDVAGLRALLEVRPLATVAEREREDQERAAAYERWRVEHPAEEAEAIAREAEYARRHFERLEREAEARERNLRATIRDVLYEEPPPAGERAILGRH